MFRVDSEVLLLTCKAFNRLRPNGVSHSIVECVPSRTLCSTAGGILEVSSRSRMAIIYAVFVHYTAEW